MWRIVQNGDQWDLVSPSGLTASAHTRYEHAVHDLAERLTSTCALVADGTLPTGPGVLEETWADVDGIAFSQATGDGPDFTGCAWTWRDPAVSLVPLMLQTSTEVGHFGAELAGFIEKLSLSNGTPHASGRFYDSEAGVTFRDLLLDGRSYGVSVDGGKVEAEWSCVQEDADGWCIEDQVLFLAYEVIGVTGTPFPAFAEARVALEATAGQAAAAPAVAAAGGPLIPPRAWFEMPEPELGSDLLVQQDEDGHFAVPLTILDDGRVFGHMAYWGQCHVGFSQVCVEPPMSPTGYAEMNLRPLPVEDGGSVLTGPLVVGCDHADLRLFAAEARDHYAHAGVAWADVHVSDGVFGPWFSGALRPEITDEQLRVLRASSVSGDWRDVGNGLDLLLGLTVNGPGFPIRGAEQPALAAGGAAVKVHQRALVSSGDGIRALVASNIVRRECPSCRDAARTAGGGDVLDRILSRLEVIEQRTRHLRTIEAATRAEVFTR